MVAPGLIMADFQKLNILLYCSRPAESENAGTVIDHIDAFGKYSGHNVLLWSSMNGLPAEDAMAKIDCIVIHYTLSLLYDKYVPADSLDRIRRFPGLKILFIQDEYRRVNFVCDKIKYAGIDLVFTCAPPEVSRKIYASLEGKVSLSTTLTGYVPEQLSQVSTKPTAERSIDVGYRARKCPFFLGRKSHEKYLIGRRFQERTKGKGLKCDLSSSEKDRIYGAKWIEFVADCKTTLGTESGASIIDFTGQIEYDLNRWQAFRPFAEFEDVPDQLLEQDGEIDLQVISPRCFEAAALGTVLVMYPGTYSGILEPGAHFLQLERNFSNIEEIVESIRDDRLLSEIAGRARKDLIDSGKYSYESFVHEFDQSALLLAKEKQWRTVGPSELGEDAFVSLPEPEPAKPAKSNFLKKLVRKAWKNAPPWIRFLVMVTVFRKSYYSHLYGLKDKYRTQPPPSRK